MKYQCLVLDHDDTAVKSTPQIHYPSFREALIEMRPEHELSLEDFISYCFDPGFSALCNDIIGFTKEESERQQTIWKRYTQSIIPSFYDGMEDIIKEFKTQGGYICVVSHSDHEMIKRDYLANCGLVPDMIFGWEQAPEHRKPNPFPLQEIMRAFALNASQLVVVDDLKPGLDMAKACGIDFVSAGWSHTIPQIKSYMEQNSDYYFERVDELKTFLF